MHQHYMASAFEAGEAKGKTEGARGLRQAVLSICELLNVEIDDAKERQLSLLEVDQLNRLVRRLKTERQWPQDL
jgi:hypothetical protein